MSEKIFKGRLVQKHDTAGNWAKAISFVPKQGEIIIYDIDDSYDYERFKIGDGVTNVNDLKFYAGSWNDLTDKPFGEEATYGDTLTWDGNTDGLTNFQDYLYKVSDLTPSLEDLKRGGVITTDNSSIESVSFTEENLQSFGDIIQIIYDEYYLVHIALTDNAMLGFNEETMEPYVLSEKGIYFHKENTNNAHSDFNTLSLEINDYTFETTTIKQIDNKYLEPFETIGGDTLTWDGNTDGRDIVGDMFCHISDVVVTVSDCANGVIATFVDGSTQGGAATELAPGLLMLADIESVLCVATDNYDFNGMIFPKKGIYVTYGDYCVTSFTINGYTGFGSTKLKESYLPEHTHDYAASSHTHDDRYYTESEVNNLLNGKANSSHSHSYASTTHNHELKNLNGITISQSAPSSPSDGHIWISW